MRGAGDNQNSSNDVSGRSAACDANSSHGGISIKNPFSGSRSGRSDVAPRRRSPTQSENELNAIQSSSSNPNSRHASICQSQNSAGSIISMSRYRSSEQQHHKHRNYSRFANSNINNNPMASPPGQQQFHQSAHRLLNINRGSQRALSSSAMGTQTSSSLHFAVPAPTGKIRNVRKGLFFSSDLMESAEAKQFHMDFPHIDRQCVIRFPPYYAAILRRRLIRILETQSQPLDSTTSNLGEQNASSSPRDSPHSSVVSSHTQQLKTRSDQLESERSTQNYDPLALGLTITPTAKEDYRMFDIVIELDKSSSSSGASHEQDETSNTRKLTGVLVELPCVIESYKTVNGDLFFKSADISQMIYVYDQEIDVFDTTEIRSKHFWEWRSGITPPTHRIRTRKFRNFEVFEKSDIQLGEKEILEILRGTQRESAQFEVISEFDMMTQISDFKAALRDVEDGVVGAPDGKQRCWLPKEPKVAYIVGEDDRIFDDVNLSSDLSDRLFLEEGEDEEEEEGGDGVADYGAWQWDSSGALSWRDGRAQDGEFLESLMSENSESSSSSEERQRRQKDKEERKKKKKEKKQRNREKEVQQMLMTEGRTDDATMNDNTTFDPQSWENLTVDKRVLDVGLSSSSVVLDQDATVASELLPDSRASS